MHKFYDRTAPSSENCSNYDELSWFDEGEPRMLKTVRWHLHFFLSTVIIDLWYYLDVGMYWLLCHEILFCLLFLSVKWEKEREREKLKRKIQNFTLRITQFLQLLFLQDAFKYIQEKQSHAFWMKFRMSPTHLRKHDCVTTANTYKPELRKYRNLSRGMISSSATLGREKDFRV